jgi:putative lipoic acid-binding regulatory protein
MAKLVAPVLFLLSFMDDGYALMTAGSLTGHRSFSLIAPSLMVLQMADEESEDNPFYTKSTIRIDDGGSDLTDRFKYKVNALMGVFDPIGVDDERQDGNIYNAMLNFPTKFTFTAVGRTNGEENIKESYINKVKDTVKSLSGDDETRCTVTPRGSKFTRVSIEVEVESAAVIASIFRAIDEIDMTVMKF